MQVLIVHEDAEIGEQLKGMLDEYTAHSCHLVGSDKVAFEWAKKHAQCHVLLAQLEGASVDGLSIGGAMSEIFPGLQTIFLPGYPAVDERMKIERRKVFPEPIDGERLLEAIERAATEWSTQRDFFHALDLLQMCCLSHKSGAVQMVKEEKSGIAWLDKGRIIHAETIEAEGTEALLEMARWDLVEFAYDGSVCARPTISSSWTEMVKAEEERYGVRRQSEATTALSRHIGP